MTFDVKWQAPDSLTTVKPPGEGLDYLVDYYSKSVWGGPKGCRLQVVDGSIYDFWNFVPYLGYGFIIYDNIQAKAVWWGRLNKLKINDGALEITVSMDDFANKIKVISNYLGQRVTTDWGTDADSITRYETYEMMLSIGDKNLELCENHRDTQLGLRSKPIVKTRIHKGSNRGTTLVIEGVGHLDQLKKRYWAQDEGYVEYTDGGTGLLKMGRGTGTDEIAEVAQSFEIPSATGWNMAKIDLHLRKTDDNGGTPPADGTYVELRTGSTVSGSSLVATSATVTDGDMSDSMDWITYTFSPSVALSTSTTYWIVLYRTGAYDDVYYFSVDVNEDKGFADGECWRKFEGTWEEVEADMNFRVYGEKETTDQVDDIMTDIPDHILDYTIGVSSGVNTNQYRDGDDIAWDELIELLEAGNSSNVRILFDVNINRKATFYLETTNRPTYRLNRNGDLLGTNPNRIISDRDCVHSCWVSFQNIIPESFDQSILSQVKEVFIDEAEYRKGIWKPTKTKGDVDVFDNLAGEFLR